MHFAVFYPHLSVVHLDRRTHFFVIDRLMGHHAELTIMAAFLNGELFVNHERVITMKKQLLTEIEIVLLLVSI